MLALYLAALALGGLHHLFFEKACENPEESDEERKARCAKAVLEIGARLAGKFGHGILEDQGIKDYLKNAFEACLAGDDISDL